MANLFRPQSFHNFVGQKQLKIVLKTMIKAAKIRKSMPDHILLFGPAGHGKTSIANIFANTLKSNLKITQGPIFDKKSDFLTFFASVRKNDVVFIDEFHAINKNIEELFYSVLEDQVIDVLLGVEGESQIMRMQLPSFTLIAATTMPHKISRPIIDRFGFTYMMLPYSEIEISKIIALNAKKMSITIKESEIKTIAEHANNNPRWSINHLKRIVDFALTQKNNDCSINSSLVSFAFKNLGIYKNGLQEKHLSYLKIFIFNKKQITNLSLENIARTLNLHPNVISIEIEPLLIKNNFIKISNLGRKITMKGKEYLQENRLFKK